MKKLLTLTSLFSLLCLGASAQEEVNENPVIQYKVTGAVESGSTVSVTDAEENEVMTVTYGPDYTGTKIENTTPAQYNITQNAKWTTSSSKVTLAGQSYTNWVSGSGNPATINEDNTLTFPSLSSAPGAGIWVKLTPATNAIITVCATNVGYNKSLYVLGGANGSKNPALQYTTGNTDEGWADFENGKTTGDVFGATGGSNIAIRFTAKAGVDYYFFLAGSKMRFLGCTYQLTTAGNADEAKKIAWVSPYDDPESNDMYRMYAVTDGYDYTAINSTTTEITADSLRTFDAVVVSTGVTASDAVYSLLEQNIAFVPMVNLNASLFGYEEQQTGNIQLVAQTTATGASDLFDGISLNEETGEFEYADVAVNVPERFASDVVYAKNEDFTAFHRHTPNRNSYILLASPADADLDTDLWSTLLANAMNMAAQSKKTVTAAANPSFSPSYVDGKTTVNLSCATSDAEIFYSLDGEDFQVYTGALSFTEPTTVYAYALAEGYEQSGTAQSDIIIKTQMAAPTISQTHATNSTTISFSAAEGAKVYFSFVKDTDPAKMALYTEPVTISEPATVYALATSDAMLPSELATAVVNIDSITSETIRLDTLAHMDCNQAEYFDAVSAYCTENYSGTGNASAFYYFGKNAWNYYQLNDDGTIKKDSVEVEGEWQYTYYPNEESLKTIDFQNGWIMKTNGQPATIECIDGPAQVGNGNTGRYADNVTDLVAGGPTKGLIDFGGKKDGEPYTLSIETTEKYQGPFDVVAYLGNGSTKEIDLKAQVSVDGKEWTTIGNLAYSSNQRYWKRSRLSYEGTEEVYVRVTGGGSKPQLYDIYLLNNGELSKQWKPKADAVLGDVNGDDEITMADANMVVNYYLAPGDYPNFPVAQADMNDDDDITMADANAIVNVYLAGGK